jgi:hypothetical protein
VWKKRRETDKRKRGGERERERESLKELEIREFLVFRYCVGHSDSSSVCISVASIYL